jgi:hypothetical protein
MQLVLYWIDSSRDVLIIRSVVRTQTRLLVLLRIFSNLYISISLQSHDSKSEISSVFPPESGFKFIHTPNVALSDFQGLVR